MARRPSRPEDWRGMPSGAASQRGSALLLARHPSWSLLRNNYVSTMAGPWCSDHESLRALHLLLRPRLYNACTYTRVRGCDCLILLVCTYGLWRQTPGPHLVTGVHEPAAVIPPRGPVTTLRPYVVRAAAGSSNSPPIRLGHDVSPGLPALVSIPFHHFYSRMLARFWDGPDKAGG